VVTTSSETNIGTGGRKRAKKIMGRSDDGKRTARKAT
jgi:hypothetical protein